MRALALALVLACTSSSFMGCGASTKSSSDTVAGAANDAKAGAAHGGGSSAGRGGGAGTRANGGSGATGGDAGSAGSGTAGTRGGRGGSGHDSAGGGAGSSGASSGAGGTATGGMGTGGIGTSGGAATAGKSGASAGGASGGKSGDGAGGQAGGGGERAIECTGTMQYFPEFERGCATDDDCIAVAHQTSCCGTELVTGISASEQTGFAAAEATCQQQYPACGCASQGVAVEDGTLLDFSWKTEVVATCDAGTCKAHYSGTSFACGTRRCTEQQYCVQSSGGPEGTPTSYSCVPTACTDCSCITMPDCTCTDNDGQLTFTCQYA